MLYLPELEALYAAMSPFARSKLIETAREYVKLWPAPKKTALLTVIQNAAPSEGLARHLDRRQNHVPMVLVGQSID
jgi:hypothetical protein